MVSRAAVTRHLPLVLSVACLLSLSMPLAAQGVAPANVVSFVDSIVWIITYLFCPAVGLFLAVSAIVEAANGHHGMAGSAAIKLVCAVALFGITVVVNWLHF